jgi:FkbM family methyltransferase
MKKKVGLLFALFLKQVFKIKYLQKHYFGIYKRIIVPLNLFENIQFQKYKLNHFYLTIHLQDWIQQQIFLLNGYEKNEINYLIKNAASINTFIDIGSNIGLYSLQLASINKKAIIYAFEPLSINYNQLVQNIKLNNFNNIYAKKLAIGHENTTIAISYSLKDNNLGEASISNKDGNEKELVSVITLDGFFEAEKVKIDLIKLDIEGNELNALNGMINILKNHKPNILIELNVENDKKHCIEIDVFLSNLGYQSHAILENGELQKNPISFYKNNNYIYTNSFLNK